MKWIVPLNPSERSVSAARKPASDPPTIATERIRLRTLTQPSSREIACFGQRWIDSITFSRMSSPGVSSST